MSLMKSKGPQNCWEYWKCKKAVREKCAAFKTDSGRECWMVAGIHSKNPTCPKVKEGILHCWDCAWFKRLNPDFPKKTA